MDKDLREIIPVFILAFFIIYSLILWLLTFFAFRQRYLMAQGNQVEKIIELIKFIFTPLISPIVWLTELLYWLFRKLSSLLIVILSPLWIFVGGVFLLIVFAPDLWDRFLGSLGSLGGKILGYNEEFPTRVSKRSSETLASFVGNVAIFLSNTPLNILVTNGKAVNTLEGLGLRSKAVSIFKSIALDPQQKMSTRMDAVRGLAKMDLIDDLIDLVRNRDLDPDIARSASAWLKAKEKDPDPAKSLFYKDAHLLAWRLLTLHHNPAMRLEAARKLNLEGFQQESCKVTLRLAQDQAVPLETRLLALEDLGYQGQDPETIQILMHLLKSDLAPGVRLASAESLARLVDPDPVVAEICKYLDTNQSPSVSKQAIETLGKLNRRFELISIRKNAYLSPENRLEACLALESSGFARSAFISLLSLALDGRIPVSTRVKALRELGNLGAGLFSNQTSASFQRIRTALISLAENESSPGAVRLGVAQALQKMGCESNAGTLFLLLSSPKFPDRGIRHMASQALKELQIGQA